ncbi:nucleopolyhedrovirus P10 family protein [Streptomyces chromofuscus]|uniref:Nucleopolyhedrovirus P10 family protein n=1 Tax=Streptomyces chromofuscus TaxID=42881 RepID=A0A7M2TCS1_STRCW|nr:nucleopolyhedrovirus P10 family protein [Streptomyces chromofuscus]QOV45929.1 nucleopolyhedrovirus P10 family protein [Streptomyces chromofuscus]
MTADRWTQAVQQQLGLGRLLPLGGPRDGAWISEGAAGTVLRRAAEAVPGVRVGALRIALADPDAAQAPAVPPPPSALPPGPLRLTADFAATATEPLPTTADRLRTTLSTAATERLGLTVTEVDLRVTALLEDETEPGAARPPQPARARRPGEGEAGAVAAAALAVPGVTCLTGVLGGAGRAVHIEESPGGAALPRRHVRVELAVDADHRAVEVARKVRTRVGIALRDHPTVAVLITAVG